MPRTARLDAPGALHHIMIRRIERQRIFRKNQDRDDLLERLSVILPETHTSCYAWAFLDNHAHFLFRSDEAGISMVMKRLLTGYVLRKFGKTVRKGRSEYLVFVEAGVSEGRKPELVGGGLIRSLGGWKEVKKLRLDRQDRMKGDERILGDGDFVMEVLATANEGYERRYRLKSLGYDISRIEQQVIGLFNIKKEDLYSHTRKRRISEARSLFCYWCVRELGESMTDMAKLLGLTQPAIGYAVERGERLTKKKYDSIG